MGVADNDEDPLEDRDEVDEDPLEDGDKVDEDSLEDGVDEDPLEDEVDEVEFLSIWRLVKTSVKVP